MTGRMADSGGSSRSRWRKWLWGVGGAIVLLPAAGMLVSDEVNWGPGDFGFAAALVIGIGGTFALLARTTESRTYRAAVGVALATTFVLLWSNAALGVIGSEDNRANVIFFGIPVVALIGALLARLQPAGMAIALAATAAAQTLAGLIALLAGGGFGPALEVLGLTAFFAAPWLLSARLFQVAAQEQDTVGA